MSTIRDALISAVLDNAASFIGTDYSRSARDNIWPGGSMDCSSYTSAIWGAAGYPLLDAGDSELRTSTYQVNAIGFDLIYPDSKSQIGKNLPSPRKLLSTYGAQDGDIVFWGFDATTTRKNKITHVGSIDKGAVRIIHTANNKEKACRKSLDYGDGYICAIIRLAEDFSLPKLPVMQKPTETSSRPEAWAVRALQAALNIKRGTQLQLDGLFGTKTEQAVEALNAEIGNPSKACTNDTWAALGFNNDIDQPAHVPEPEEWPVILRQQTPYMRGSDIQSLQAALNALGYDCGAADGICGPKTMAGVRAFARAHL
ncbi:peptidoglycan-binding protein [Christensenellaceae bacterium OttesenSCG-928-M15]|nr:peptidoglycan-binding protein [Christensenellaceae bacterium OttesenSCG-928-M15]